MRKLLKEQGFAPRLLVIDKLRSYASAFGRDNPRKGVPTVRRQPRRRRTATGMQADGIVNLTNPGRLFAAPLG
jgi:transposase-like protein